MSIEILTWNRFFCGCYVLYLRGICRFNGGIVNWIVSNGSFWGSCLHHSLNHRVFVAMGFPLWKAVDVVRGLSDYVQGFVLWKTREWLIVSCQLSVVNSLNCNSGIKNSAALVLFELKGELWMESCECRYSFTTLNLPLLTYDEQLTLDPWSLTINHWQLTIYSAGASGWISSTSSPALVLFRILDSISASNSGLSSSRPLTVSLPCPSLVPS